MNSFNGWFFKRILLASIAIVVTVGISACGEQVEKMRAEETAAPVVDKIDIMRNASVADIITRAKATYAEAAALSHAWTTTRTLIDQASTALEAGEKERARELAEQALGTARASVEQARVEAEDWRSRVPQ